MPRPRRSTPKIMRQAGQLRKTLTPAERKLWSALRGDQLGVSFRRQHAIGPYIADFACIQKKLIIELDGEQHLEQVEYDEERTKYLESLGYKVIRFWNNEVMKDMDGVIRAIWNALEEGGTERIILRLLRRSLIDGQVEPVEPLTGTLRNVRTLLP